MWFWATITIISIQQCIGAQDLTVTVPVVNVRKCCLAEELIDNNYHCQHVNVSYSEPLKVPFYDENSGLPSSQIPSKYVGGLCSACLTIQNKIMHFVGFHR